MYSMDKIHILNRGKKNKQTVDSGHTDLTGQLGHFSGQSNVRAVGQRTTAARLLTGFIAVSNLMERMLKHQSNKTTTTTIKG